RQAPVALTVRRAGAAQAITVTLAPDKKINERDPNGRRLSAGAGSAGYMELTQTSGSPGPYVTKAQKALRAGDQTAACGWIIDVRRSLGGDMWSYLAGIGPVLGEGQVGGFVYPDGQREAWEYRGGKVFWNGNERQEDALDGPIYQAQRATAPVALLTS